MKMFDFQRREGSVATEFGIKYSVMIRFSLHVLENNAKYMCTHQPLYFLRHFGPY